MTREVMINKMIDLYGHKNPITIQFYDICKRWADTEQNTKALEILCKAHLENPVTEDQA